MAETITLRCPECGREKPDVARERWDHPHATVVEIYCGEPCGQGGMEPPVYYYAADGCELLDDPACYGELPAAHHCDATTRPRRTRP